MNFVVPTNASRDEINAIAERGIDAMFDAYDAGEEALTVAFVHEGKEEEEEKKGEEEINNNDKKYNNDINNINDDDDSKKDEEEDSCPVCGHDPCLFEQQKELLLALDEAEHGGEGEETPANNIRRKKLYRQLTLLLNDGPLGVGVRKELPSCCVDAVRDMLPSETFMGFRAE